MNSRFATVFSVLLLLAGVLVSGLLPGAYAQQNDVTVTIPEVEPDVGQTVTLSIETDLGGNEVDSYSNMEFTFDSSVINIVDVRDGDELSFGQITDQDTIRKEDTLRVSNIADAPVEGSGEFLEIEVELTQDAGIAFQLTPSNTDIFLKKSIFVLPDGSDLEVDSIDQGRVGQPSQSQFIHNAADPAAQTVDIYFGEERVLDDFSFRDATSFIDVLPAGIPVDVGVAPGGSGGPGDIIDSQTVTFDPDSTYTVVANGVLDPSQFVDNPDGEPIAFEFFVESGAKATAGSGEVDLRAVHGATDAPTVDIEEGTTTLLDDLTYRDVTTDYLTVTAEEKQILVTPGNEDNVLAPFEVDLSGLGGNAATVLASGFLDPEANQDGPGFALVAALPNGDVETFPPEDDIPIYEARLQGPDSTVTVEGTVTRAFGSYVRLQDASGPTGASGLVIRQTEDDSLGMAFREDITNDNITQGTRLQVTGTLSEFAGLLQINNEDFEDYNILGQGSLPPVQTVSLSDIQGPDGEDYESELIRVENLSFPNRDTTDGTLNGSTTYVVEDGTGATFPYRVQDSTETAVIGASIPMGTFTYEGVLGQFNNFSENDEGYQLIPVRISTGLPVEFAGFDAVRNGSTVELRWQTASETNNAGFRVQREAAEGWQELGFVQSKATDGTTTEAQSYRFVVERDLEPGTHRFRLNQVDLDGSTTPSRVVSVEVRMDEALSLTPPAPNPASGQTTLSFGVKKATEAQVVLYNVLGQRVKTLYNGTPRAGQSKTVTFDTASLSSGVYVLQLRANGQTRTQRLTVVQ